MKAPTLAKSKFQILNMFYLFQIKIKWIFFWKRETSQEWNRPMAYQTSLQLISKEPEEISLRKPSDEESMNVDTRTDDQI